MNTVEVTKREVVNSGVLIGSIIAWFPRLFHESTPNTVDTQNRIKLSDDWAICDGRDLSTYNGSISDSDYINNPIHNDSPLIVGLYKKVPDLSDDRLIMGNGTFGLNPLGGNNNNEITISSANLPLHTHGAGTLQVPLISGVSTGMTDVGHSHGILHSTNNIISGGNLAGTATYDGPNGNGTQHVILNHSHSIVIPSGSFAGNTDNGGFVNSAVNILPKYLKVIYIMKVK